VVPVKNTGDVTNVEEAWAWLMDPERASQTTYENGTVRIHVRILPKEGPPWMIRSEKFPTLQEAVNDARRALEMGPPKEDEA
jgi:hypothetical protein